MDTNSMVIDMQQVPAGYVYCFNESCPLNEECLRWIASQRINPEIIIAKTVLPTILQQQQCPYYRKAETLHMAWGFNKLFAEVKSKDEASLRLEMKTYLGGNGTYSRYKLGRRLLTPQQQEYIINLFRARGYSDGLEFDHYVDTYDFDH